MKNVKNESSTTKYDDVNTGRFQYTMQVHQKNCDKCDSIKRFWFWCYNGGLWDFFFIFQANLRNQEIVYQHNITEKYYKIGRSKLHWEI